MAQNGTSYSLLRNGDGISGVNITTFKVATGVVFAIGALSVLGRAGARFYARQRPLLHDYLVFFGFACLTAAISLLYLDLEDMYMVQLLYRHPEYIAQTHNRRVNLLFSYPLVALLWSSIYAIKLSYLALFKSLIVSAGKFQFYYWTAVGVVIISWIVSGPLSFFVQRCLHTGSAIVKCDSIVPRWVLLAYFINILNIFTDLMVVSIPILVIRQTKIHVRQKITTGCFFCLSIFMIGTTIVRMSKTRGASGWDIPWQFFWFYIEAAVAIITASLTAYRTVFVKHKRRQEFHQRMKKPPTWRRWGYRIPKSVSEEHVEAGLPRYPSRLAHWNGNFHTR